RRERAAREGRGRCRRFAHAPRARMEHRASRGDVADHRSEDDGAARRHPRRGRRHTRRRHPRPHRRDRPARAHRPRRRRRLRAAEPRGVRPAPKQLKEHDMRLHRLGRTALQVSELCLGTMNFGPLTTQDDSFVIMDRALDLGINFFDTANRYGGPKGPGTTETIIGNWFAQGGGRREKVVLATKVFGPMTEWPNDGGLSARHIRDACEASLRRLQTDHIDLYQMHHVDRNAPWDEVWQAMETLVDQGKVVYVGSSNFAGWHIAQANEAAAKRHFLGLVSEQSLYNLAARTVELEVLPACKPYGLAVLPGTPPPG